MCTPWMNNVGRSNFSEINIKPNYSKQHKVIHPPIHQYLLNGINQFQLPVFPERRHVLRKIKDGKMREWRKQNNLNVICFFNSFALPTHSTRVAFSSVRNFLQCYWSCFDAHRRGILNFLLRSWNNFFMTLMKRDLQKLLEHFVEDDALPDVD